MGVRWGGDGAHALLLLSCDGWTLLCSQGLSSNSKAATCDGAPAWKGAEDLICLLCCGGFVGGEVHCIHHKQDAACFVQEAAELAPHPWMPWNVDHLHHLPAALQSQNHIEAVTGAGNIQVRAKGERG